MKGVETFQGTPCRRCEGTERYLGGECVTCQKAKSARRYVKEFLPSRVARINLAYRGYEWW